MNSQQFLKGIFWIILTWWIAGCTGKNDLLVVRSDGHSEAGYPAFDSVLLTTALNEELLRNSGHVLIEADDATLTFAERNALERYLEAGGRLTFTCRDTIYNWGQLQPFLQDGRATISCEETPNLQKSALDYAAVQTPLMPDMDRLMREVLVAPLAEPMALVVTKNSLVYWIERRGSIHMYHPGEDQSREIDRLEVYDGHEDGLLGIVLDPDFEENKWAYFFYSVPEEAIQRVSRFCFSPNGLDRESEKVLLEIPVQREECCHSAGDLEFDSEGNLYISTGDNTFSRASDGFTPMDERPGRSAFDAQKSSGNTHDLRGKVLRIRPQADGTYTIPDDNLFPKDGSKGLSEIYTMGARNPFTIAIHPQKDWLYWGDVGPDGNVTSERGPTAHDEINLAKAPGNYGWPFFNANNLAYADYDFEIGVVGSKFDPQKPINNSPNNTGMKELPPAVPAMIYYTFDETRQFPGVGKGSRSVGTGEIYDFGSTIRHNYEFPRYFDGKLFAFDWARDWIKVITMDQNGDFQSIESFLDQSVLASPIDMTFGPDGALYVLEYGIGYFTNNHDSKLIRLDFVTGNRPPEAVISITPASGKVPLEVNLSAEGSSDSDGDALSYQWQLSGPETISDEGITTNVILREIGEYQVDLLVTDVNGATSILSEKIQTGNTVPKAMIRIAKNQSFYWPGAPIEYQIQVSDAEDGTLGEGIDPNEVGMYLTRYSGSDNRAPASLAVLDDLDARDLPTGLQIIQRSDCKSCHKINQSSIGPSFYQIAERYDQDYLAVSLLTDKIIKGGGGNWGDGAMIAHPDISEKAAEAIIDYIFSVNDPAEDQQERIEMTGTVTPTSPNDKFRFEVSYTDKGGNAGSLPMKVNVEKTLKPPVLQAELADQVEGFEIRGAIADGDDRYVYKDGKSPLLMFQDIDLTNIGALEVHYFVPTDNPTSEAIELEIYADEVGENLIAKANIDPQKSDESTLQMELNTEGIHDLYLTLKSRDDAYLIGIDRVEFHQN